MSYLPVSKPISTYTGVCVGGGFCSLFLQELGLTILIHSVKITEEKFINNRVKSWPLS